MNKNFFILTLLSMSLCIASQSSSTAPASEKKFNQVKKDYAAPKAEIKDITITDAVDDAGFFRDKTLENVVFKGAVSGDWVNVLLKGTITFQELPKGKVDEKTQKNKQAILISKDAKTIKIDKVKDNTLGFKY